MPIDPVPSTIRALLADTRIQAALDYLKDDHDRTIAELKEMVLVHGAPHTEPEVRSPMYRDKLARYGLEDCFIDEVGNAFGDVRGAGARPKILAEAHLDTVFPADTPLAVQEKDGVLHCPGIADDTAALAAQLSIIRAIRHAGLVPCGTFMMGGTVGEEAPGEARGVRALMASQTDLDAYLALEGGHMFDIIPGAVACKRQEIIVTGPGGHSWSDFGLASPINALGRAIARIADLHPVASPKTTYNVGLVSGGTSVNAIAHEARMHVDIRSTDTAERNKLEALIMDQIRLAVDEENAAHPGAPLHLANRPYGDKPGGEMPADHLIVRAALAATEAVGIHAELLPPASTNANFPISAGIPALCLNISGKCANIHSLEEWYDPTDSYLGAQETLLLLFALGGLAGVTEPLLGAR